MSLQDTCQLRSIRFLDVGAFGGRSPHCHGEPMPMPACALLVPLSGQITVAAPVPDSILDRLRPNVLIRALMPTTRLLFRDSLFSDAGTIRQVSLDRYSEGACAGTTSLVSIKQATYREVKSLGCPLTLRLRPKSHDGENRLRWTPNAPVAVAHCP